MTYLQIVNKSTSLTGEDGVNGVALLLSGRLGWTLRRQSEVDVGVDGQIEVFAEGEPTGRLIGVQAKAGPSFFANETRDGSAWVFRDASQEHRDYWLNYQLPVIITLYDPARHTAYWQHITPDTAEITGKGFKVLVPKSQRIDEAAEQALSTLAARLPANGLHELLLQLPYSCAARLRLLDAQSPAMARRLARELVAGRSTGGPTARRLLDEAARGWPHAASAVLGEYALEYGDAATAAEFFIYADQTAEQDQRGRWAAFAGALLSASDPSRSRELFSAASAQPGGRLLGPLGLAGLDHGAQSGPIPIPDVVTADEEADRDPAVQRFLADQAQRAGDLALALKLHERAFALAPENPIQQLAVADMLLQRPPNRSAADLKADFRRAAKLASGVRGAKRRWQGDSVPAARLLQSALILAGDTERAFRVATRQPEGEATDTEAASASLAVPVAKIAYEQGRMECAETFAAVVEEGDDETAAALLAAVREKAIDGDNQEQCWRTALACTTDPGSQVVILDELAELGCWPLHELDKLRDDAQLRPGSYDVIHARALEVQGETKAAQALLRRHLQDSSPAAERYVKLLAAADRTDEAIAVCDQAANRFGDSRHHLHALDVLDNAGRADQLLSRAADLLSRASIPYSLRHHVRSKLLQIHERRRDWAAAESLATAGLEEVSVLLDDLREGKHDPLSLPADSRSHLELLRHAYTWTVVRFQFNQGRTSVACATCDSLAPEITNADEASLWVDLHHLHAWTLDTIQRAFELIEQLTLPEQVIGRILFTLLQSTDADTRDAPDPDGTPDITPVEPAEDLGRIPIPSALHQQISDGWRTHLERRAATEQAGPDSRFMSEQALSDRAQPRVARQLLANAAIWGGRLPAGAASQAAEAPYLLTLAERRARILPMADPDPETYRGEVEAARASLGEAVSIETTSLFVLAALLDQWPAAYPEFSDLLLAEPLAHDIRLSHVAARALGGSVRYLGIDPTNGAPTPIELGEEVLRRIRRQTSAVHAAAQDCTAVHVPDLHALGDGMPHDINGPWPWLSSIALAAERGIALYCDDASLRALARSRGIRTFGSLALLEALGAGHAAAPDPGLALAFLFAHHAVDLPDIDGLVHNALNAGDATSEPVLINLARPAFWQHHNADFADTVVSVVAPANRQDPQALGSLTEAITIGATAAFVEIEATAAVVATAILAGCTGVTRDASDVVVPIVRAVAAQHGVEPISQIREMLVTALTDSTATFQLTTGGAAQVVDHALRLGGN